MSKTLNITSTIEAVTTYAGDKTPVLTGRNNTVTLPEVTRVCNTIKTALGDQDIPSYLIDDMETSITKVGIDKNMAKMTKPDVGKWEYRWIQDVIQTDGTVKKEGCKAFLSVHPVTIAPGGSIEVGSSSENDLTAKVTVYKLVAGGEEIIYINKITGEIRVFGKSYGIDDNDELL